MIAVGILLCTEINFDLADRHLKMAKTCGTQTVFRLLNVKIVQDCKYYCCNVCMTCYTSV